LDIINTNNSQLVIKPTIFMVLLKRAIKKLHISKLKGTGQLY